MISSKESAALPEETKLKMLKEAKLGTWTDNWKPYCGTCDTFNRMEQHDYGFRCKTCRNMIGWDLCRLSDSPLNNVKHDDKHDDIVINCACGGEFHKTGIAFYSAPVKYEFKCDACESIITVADRRI